MTARPRKAAAKKAPARSAAAQAQQAEAAGDGFVTIEQCGVTLRVPVAGKVPLKALMAFMAGDEIGGTELLLGAKQWDQFMAADPTVEDFKAIGTKLQDHGTSAGN